MTDLKNCPFCGSEAVIYGDNDRSRSIGCNSPSCPAEMCGGIHGETVWDDVVTAWNTRAKPRLPRVQPADLVEGKWYVVTGSGIVDNGDTFHACCLRSKFSGTLVLAAGVSAWYGHLIKTIHGPLPEYELESEVSDG